MQNFININPDKKADFSMSYDFPLKVYETNLEDKPGKINEWHWHDEFQFCIIEEGHVIITVEQKNYKLNKGEGIFINSGILHTTRCISSSPAKYLCINMHPSFLSFFRGNIIEQKYILPYLEMKEPVVVILKPENPQHNKILESQKKIQFFMEKKYYGYELDIYIEMMKIWRILILTKNTSQKYHSFIFHHKEIKEIISFIQENYSKHISLDDISSHIHMSKSWCCRIFKQALHCTILQYLTEIRIKKSMTLLLSTDLTVTEIAYNTGFSDTSYFIKKFNETVHMTPRAYRIKAQGKR